MKYLHSYSHSLLCTKFTRFYCCLNCIHSLSSSDTTSLLLHFITFVFKTKAAYISLEKIYYLYIFSPCLNHLSPLFSFSVYTLICCFQEWYKQQEDFYRSVISGDQCRWRNCPQLRQCSLRFPGVAKFLPRIYGKKTSHTGGETHSQKCFKKQRGPWGNKIMSFQLHGHGNEIFVMKVLWKLTYQFNWSIVVVNS